MRTFDLFVFRFLFLVSLVWHTPVAQGQSLADTAFTIQTVEIEAGKIRQHATGSSTQEWSKTQLDKLPANNLAELLAAETGAYIKSYGMGSLATSAVRGGSAGHTLVLWNGLPVHSPMLGLLDLALLPTQAVDAIGFTAGGNTALWGSGAIGGVLNLNNEADFSKKIQLKSSTQAGNFGQFQQQFSFGLGGSKIQSMTRLSYQQAENNFYYFLTDGLPERQQTNARLSQQYLLQDFYWKITGRNRLALHVWRQQSDRQIPPTNVQTRSEAHQDDLATRLILEYRHTAKNSIWQAKTGFFDERLNYFDDRILLESRSHFRAYLAELTGQWNWGKRHHFLLGNTHTHTRAWSAGYRETVPEEYRAAFFASWKFQLKKLHTQFSLRQELADGKRAPLVPAFGFDFFILHPFVLKGKFSRNYRLPTLNDRFWMPGGNPDLLPESGWSQELTLAYTLKKKRFEIDASLTAYNREIDNWILWSLREGQAFWSSNNITRVWSRGLEPRLSVAYFIKNLKLQLRGGYDYTRSTNQVALKNPKIEAGDQLIYTPVHQAFGVFSLEWQGLYLAYQHRYTGAARGINDPLEAFQVGNLRLQYSGALKKIKGALFLNINNVWDADYLVVERRPMPGIHVQYGIQLFFNQNL